MSFLGALFGISQFCLRFIHQWMCHSWKWQQHLPCQLSLTVLSRTIAINRLLLAFYKITNSNFSKYENEAYFHIIFYGESGSVN